MNTAAADSLTSLRRTVARLTGDVAGAAVASRGELTSRAIVGGLRDRLRKAYAGTSKAAEVEAGDLAALRRLSRDKRVTRRAKEWPLRITGNRRSEEYGTYRACFMALNPLQSVKTTWGSLHQVLNWHRVGGTGIASYTGIAAVGVQDPRTVVKSVKWLEEHGFLIHRRRFDPDGTPICNEYKWLKPPQLRTPEDQAAIDALTAEWRVDVHLVAKGPLVAATTTADDQVDVGATTAPDAPAGPLDGLSEAERGRAIAGLFEDWWKGLGRGAVPPMRPSRKERALMADYLDDAGSIERCRHALELVNARIGKARWDKGIQWLGGTRDFWPSALEQMQLREDGPPVTWEESLSRLDPDQALAILLSGHDPVTEAPIATWDEWYGTWESVKLRGHCREGEAGNEPFTLDDVQWAAIETFYGRTPAPVPVAPDELAAARVELGDLVAALKALAPVEGGKWSVAARERAALDALAADLQSQSRYLAGAGDHGEAVDDFRRGVAELRTRLHPERGRE